MKKIFHSEDNPLPWLDYMLNAVEHTNFLKIVLPSMLVLAPQVTGKIFLNRRIYANYR